LFAMTATLLTGWQGAKRRLQAAGVEGPVIDARLLVEAAAGATRSDIIADPHRILSEAQSRTLDDFIARRERREPISHILGVKGFWKIMVRVTPDVLTPRPDTETILDVVLPGFAEDASFSVLDLGVGSGAVLLAILAERPRARGLGVDVSADALAVARENAANLGLVGRAAFLRGDWTAGLEDEGFDLVVANPPYIPAGISPGWPRRFATMSRVWPWMAVPTAWTPIAPCPRKSCASCVQAAGSPWRSGSVSARRWNPFSRRPAPWR
jgi:release factor glutamine methyltransferase